MGGVPVPWASPHGSARGGAEGRVRGVVPWGACLCRGRRPTGQHGGVRRGGCGAWSHGGRACAVGVAPRVSTGGCGGEGAGRGPMGGVPVPWASPHGSARGGAEGRVRGVVPWGACLCRGRRPTGQHGVVRRGGCVAWSHGGRACAVGVAPRVSTGWCGGEGAWRGPMGGVPVP